MESPRDSKSSKKDDAEATIDHTRSAELSRHESGEQVFTKREDGPDYRAVSWSRAAILIIKTQIGLGILSMPTVLETLGFVPDGGYVVGQFKIKHPEVHSVADIGYILGGPVLREIVGIAYLLNTVFVAGSGILSLSIAFNVISGHAICTMGFLAISLVITIAFALLRTLSHVSWLGWLGVISITASILVTIISVSVQDRPSSAPQTGPIEIHTNAFGKPSFERAFVAVVDIVFSFTGAPMFPSIISEMKEPNDYFKALFVGQPFVFFLNLIVGVVVYYYCGQYVSSPAMGSASPLMEKVAYGIALPALIVTCFLYTHFAAKYLFVRVLRHTRHLQDPTFTHWATWISITSGCAIVSFIIASAIPFFSSLVGLVGSLFSSPLTISLQGFMWFHMYWNSLLPKDEKGKRSRSQWSLSKWFLVFVNIGMVVIGTICCIAGTYSSAYNIKELFDLGEVGSAFSCRDNS